MKKIFTIGCLILCLIGLSRFIIKVFAEGGTGSIPSSGVNSRIKTIDDELIGLDFGTSGSGVWGDWGAMWNRIYSAAIWNATLGDAVASDVISGKKFYAGANRTLLTGTYSAPAVIDYSLQQYSTRDDLAGPPSNGTEDYQGEESVWTSTVANVWKDTRTGLYWSNKKGTGTVTNSFTTMSLNTCDFFNTTPRGNYAGGDADCGAAINYCATLDFGGKTDWYLPSQKEMMQAFINGMFNQAGTSLADAAIFTGQENFWSSSERSNSDPNVWYVNFATGGTNINAKGTSMDVRCVRRD